MTPEIDPTIARIMAPILDKVEARAAERRAYRACIAANIFARYEHWSSGWNRFECPRTAWFNAGRQMREARWAKQNGWHDAARRCVRLAMADRKAAKRRTADIAAKTK